MTDRNALSRENLTSLYRNLVLIRRFEDRVYHLFLQSEIPGTLHQYQGQEAVAVGVCSCLRREDWITSTHRPHGHALAKGVAPSAAMAELYGRATGCCGGKGGSMHLGDPAVGMVPAIAIVAGGNSIVTGLGMSFKLRATDQVAACFFGEGATNEGAFHEGLNLSAVQRLPIVFVCENNLYGASTSYEQVSRIREVSERARSYGITAETVDGMDVLAVHEATTRAVAECRQGNGPVLLECKTYRFTGHSRSDARGYRTREEEALWQERDPIPRMARYLCTQGFAEVGLQSIESEVDEEIDRAVDFARTSPAPAIEEAFEAVFA